MNEHVDNITSELPESRPGPFLAKVVSHLDPGYMGMLEVEILRPVGNDSTSGELHQVKMMSPFWGQTSIDYVTADPNDYNNTQKSYGMWFVPPDVGTIVVVIFIDGDPKRGYWMGCVPDEAMNFMVPGIAATEFTVDGEGRVPVAEYNKVSDPEASNPTQVKKPKHPLTDVLDKQGLLKDDIRGITSSSARREVPSAVFGISTPGPVDKQSGAKTGTVGKSDSAQPNVFVSRLGGTTFVMDDGDDKFIRKTPPGGEKGGPPEYVALENGETGGEVTIPHNELVRIRTRTGHQILLHNSEDLIYITNSRGTAWIELTSNGKIDIYAQDSISLHTEVDFNVTAGRDINLTAANNINLNAAKNINQQTGADWNVKVGAAGKITTAGTLDVKAGAATKITSAAGLDMKGTDVKLTASGSLDIKSGGTSTWSGGGQVSIGGSAVVVSGGSINLNGPAAPAAGEAATAAAAANAPVTTRVPQTEPWVGHENLNPTGADKEKTKAVDPEAEKQKAEEPKYYKNYTTSIDTFKSIKPPVNDSTTEES